MTLMNAIAAANKAVDRTGNLRIANAALAAAYAANTAADCFGHKNHHVVAGAAHTAATANHIEYWRQVNLIKWQLQQIVEMTQ